MEYKTEWGTKHVESTEMLGIQKCWEGKNVGSSKMLGVRRCWEYKIVGSTKILGVKKCWEYQNVGSTKMLGVKGILCSFIWSDLCQISSGGGICTSLICPIELPKSSKRI